MVLITGRKDLKLKLLHTIAAHTTCNALRMNKYCDYLVHYPIAYIC